MMLVRTYIATSAIHGLGVFAAEPIKKNSIVWRFDTELSVVIEPETLNTFPLHIRDWLNHHSFCHPSEPKNLIVECDDGRFMNHFDKPNLDMSSILNGIALRDIGIDEELTYNYADECVRKKYKGC
jgi:SET domain-containing protein